MKYYNTEFYKNVESGAINSSEAVLPIVEDLIKPKSVIDVGCGNGAWLHYFQKKNIKIKGVDGDYVDKSILKIPIDCFLAHDLTKPLKLNEKYDLAMSLEVAEHLDEKYADIFIDSLTSLSDVILFSAAVPLSRSVSHVNEQWQSYWAEKFLHRDFFKIDCIRHNIWNNPLVEWWYAQDVFLYASKTAIDNNSKLRQQYDATKSLAIDIVHPRFFIERALPENYYLEDIFKAMPEIFKKIILRKKAKK